jgi:hypothetical protein
MSYNNSWFGENMKTFATLICLLMCLVMIPAQGKDTDAGEYRAYWLTNKDLGEYVDLLLLRRPLADIPKVTGAPDKPLLEYDAIIVRTYAKDSIWNTDRKPFKPLTGVQKVGSDSITIDGREFTFTKAELDNVKKLLETPEGKIPIHRICGPVSGQEEFVKSLALKIGQQSEAIRKETNQQAQKELESNWSLTSELIKSYRAEYEKSEYLKLNVFSKQGYDWFWAETINESSGFKTAKERKRILEKYGNDSLQLWIQGWKSAEEIYGRAVNNSKKQKESQPIDRPNR